ncbi:MAG: hypothetical protein WC043_09835 [Pseudobdellovibrionaceae bacterium]
MANIDFNHLRDLARIHFEVAAARGEDVPMGIALHMRDGHVLGWDNVRSDMNEGDDMLAEPLHCLIAGQGITMAEDLAPAQEVDTIVICGEFGDIPSAEQCLSNDFKDALAAYPGVASGQLVHVEDALTRELRSFKL